MVAGKQYEVFVHKGRPVWKIITGILFSHMGLFVLCIGYGAAGRVNFRTSQCVFYAYILSIFFSFKFQVHIFSD